MNVQTSSNLGVSMNAEEVISGGIPQNQFNLQHNEIHSPNHDQMESN